MRKHLRYERKAIRDTRIEKKKRRRKGRVVAFNLPSRNIRLDSCQIRISDFNRREGGGIPTWRGERGEKWWREVRGDGQARYRRGKTGAREGGSR